MSLSSLAGKKQTILRHGWESRIILCSYSLLFCYKFLKDVFGKSAAGKILITENFFNNNK
jgi:hypothetical protein